MSRFPDLNVVDDFNSTTAVLGAGGSYTGAWTDVSGYTSVSVLVHADAAAASSGFHLHWSSNAIDVDNETRYDYAGSASEAGKIVHSTVGARYFQVHYANSTFTPQTFFRLQTLLRRGPASSSLGQAGIAITQEYDALTTNSVLWTPRIDQPSTLVAPRSTGDPFLIVATPPNRTTISERIVTASTAFSQALDLFGVFGGTRRWFTAYNDTARGTLYIRLGSSASLTDYYWKVPPRCTWNMPKSWGDYSGSINGIWDIADGQARTVEHF